MNTTKPTVPTASSDDIIDFLLIVECGHLTKYDLAMVIENHNQTLAEICADKEYQTKDKVKQIRSFLYDILCLAARTVVKVEFPEWSADKQGLTVREAVMQMGTEWEARREACLHTKIFERNRMETSVKEEVEKEKAQKTQNRLDEEKEVD